MRSALAALVLFGQLQLPPMPELGETIEVSIVNVDVFVTDKNGKRVHGLTREDFEILEDGKPQEISNFAEYRGEQRVDAMSVEPGVPDAAPATAPAPPAARRTIVIFLEQQRLLPFHRDDFVRALTDFVRATIRPGDQVAVLSYGNVLVERVPLTGDVALVERVINQIMARRVLGHVTETNVQAEVESNRAFDRQLMADAVARGVPPPDPLGDGPAPGECVQRALWEYKRKARAITAVVNAMADLEGRKVLVLATSRFGEYAALGCGEGTRSQLSTKVYRDQLVAAANANGVTIYGMHPATIEASLPTAMESTMRPVLPDVREYEILTNEIRGLHDIATQTGGFADWGPEVVKMLPRIEADLESYYSLAYRATNTRTDRRRNIVVRAKRSDLVVRSRTNVIEKSMISRMKDRALAGLAYSVRGAKIPIGVEAEQPRTLGFRKYTIKVKVKIPIASLVTLEEGDQHRGAISIFVATGAGATHDDVTQRTWPFAISTADLAKARSSHFRYELDVPTRDPAQRVSVAVYDEVGRDFGIKRVDLRKRK